MSQVRLEERQYNIYLALLSFSVFLLRKKEIWTFTNNILTIKTKHTGMDMDWHGK